MIQEEFSWITSDKLKIFAKHCKPEGNVKGAIALIHGLGEHSGRYEEVISFFISKGFAVITYDRRGHGLSEGKRGHTPSYQALLDEIEQLLKCVSDYYPEKPCFIYAHSMGGNLSLSYILRNKPTINGLITTAPWIELAFTPPKLLIFFARLINVIYPTFTQSNQLDVNFISSNKAEVAKYVNDPLIHDYITSSMAIGMFASCDWLLEKKRAISVPVLMMHGTGDKIISSNGTEKLSQLLEGDVTYKAWEGLYHEIHKEPTHQSAIFDYTYNWLVRQLDKSV